MTKDTSDKDCCGLCGGTGEVQITPYGQADSHADVFGCPACIQADRDEAERELDILAARVEVAEAGYQAAVKKAEWQARTNNELNALTLKMATLVGQRDQLQVQLETERASLFAENQRKQQLEQQVEELVGAFEAMLEEVAGCYCTTEAAARAVIQKVRGGE